MFTSTTPKGEEDAAAFDERTAAALQSAIAYLSEIVTQDRTELPIAFLQSQLERNGHEFEVPQCQFLRDCMIAEEKQKARVGLGLREKLREFDRAPGRSVSVDEVITYANTTAKMNHATGYHNEAAQWERFVTRLELVVKAALEARA